MCQKVVEEGRFDARSAIALAKRAHGEVDFAPHLRWGLATIRRAAEAGHYHVRDPIGTSFSPYPTNEIIAAYHDELRRLGFCVERFGYDPKRGNYYDNLPYTLISWYPSKED